MAGLAMACTGLALGGEAASAQSLENERGPLPTLEITPGNVKAFRTAVLLFHEVGPPVGAERVATLRDEIERGLRFSSVVLPLEHAAYLASDESPPLDTKLGESMDFDCDSWKQSGADAVLQGAVRRDEGRLRADLRVWDIARCTELKTGSVAGDCDDLADLGRIVADETVGALTGTRGVAATEIAFMSDRTGHRELYVMDADGRDQRPATHSRFLKMAPEWIPDGRALLYV
jgi:TolB protein